MALLDGLIGGAGDREAGFVDSCEHQTRERGDGLQKRSLGP